MLAPQIYLASASPRRRVLLEQMGIHFELMEVAVDEAWDGCEDASVHVQRLALEKARAGWQKSRSTWQLPVLGADTIILLDGGVLGKPSDRSHALAMLTRLSGRSHNVITAVALVHDTHEAIRLCSSQVTFALLSPAQTLAYWETGEPLDKAGSYAIQGRAGAFVTRLEGSYSGVMGLPLFETAEVLREFGIEV